MAEEHLSLKWNNHQAHFVDILTFLREKGMFVDVTLACGGKVYSAHKFVLSTCSDYFQKIFSKNTSANPVVFMKDVSCNDIEALLDFMYHGEVNVPQSSLGSLIKTAEGLQIKGLAVPDDPPSRKKQDRDKRERDPSSSSHYESRSPPPKRRSRNSPPRRNSARAIPPPVETYLDNNEADDVALRNSPPTTNSHDAHSSSDTASKIKKPHVANDSSEEHSSDGKGPCDKEHSGDSNNETPQAPNCDGLAEHDDTAGPSGLRQSKQEEMEIKQEDVVELGEDDDDGVDWGGGMGDDGGGGGGGNNDGLNSGDNSVSFSDVLLPPPDQGGGGGGIMDGAGSGDSAMVKLTGPHSPPSDSHQTVRALHSTLLRPDQPPDMFTNAIVTGGLGVDAPLPRIISISSGGRGTDGLVLQPSRGPDLSSESLDIPVANISMSQRSFPSTSLSAGRNGRRGSSNSGGFACPLCDRVMLFKSAFAKHMRTHTGEKPFACEFCSYRSAQVSNLNVHLRTVHKQFAPSHQVRQQLHLIRQQQYASQLHESEQRQDAYASQSALLPLQLPQQPPPELHHFLSGQEHEQGPADQHSSSEALDLQ